MTTEDCDSGAYSPAFRGRIRQEVAGDSSSKIWHGFRYRASRSVFPFEDETAYASSKEHPDLIVLVDDQYDPKQFDRTNLASLRTKVPWIGYKNVSTRVEIGPTVIPFETACYTCLELRREGNPENQLFSSETLDHLASAGKSLGQVFLSPGIDLLALEVIKIIARFSSPVTYGSLYTLDLLTLESRIHPVLKIPRCPACGRLESRPQTDFWLGESLRTQ